MIKSSFFYSKPTPYLLRAGNMLISMPLSGDTYFDRTVILLVEHNENGSLGVILNKNIPDILKNTFKNVEIKNNGISLFNGGPVDFDNLVILHTYGDLIKGSAHIIDGLYFGGNPHQLVQYLQDDALDENLIRFYLGYSVWAAGQLEEEMKKKMWVIGQYQEKFIFHNDDDECWKMAVKSLGKPYHSWFNIVKQPFLN